MVKNSVFGGSDVSPPSVLSPGFGAIFDPPPPWGPGATKTTSPSKFKKGPKNAQKWPSLGCQLGFSYMEPIKNRRHLGSDQKAQKWLFLGVRGPPGGGRQRGCPAALPVLWGLLPWGLLPRGQSSF